MTNYLTINSIEDLQTGCDQLIQVEPIFAMILQQTGLPPLRRRKQGFQDLAKIIVSQQLSNASAAAIWQKLEACVIPFTPEILLKMSDQQLRDCGLSAGKVRTLTGIAKKLLDDKRFLDKCARASDHDVRINLTSLSGIGPWTADIYLLACLGRADVWPSGDLALQKAVAHSFKLESRPGSDEMEHLSQAWRPWRAVAARLLWAYYSGPMTKKDN